MLGGGFEGHPFDGPFTFCMLDFIPMLIKIAGGDPLVYTFFIKKCKGGGLRNPRPQDVSTMLI
jgi:hypothetical protein